VSLSKIDRRPPTKALAVAGSFGFLIVCRAWCSMLTGGITSELYPLGGHFAMSDPIFPVRQ